MIGRLIVVGVALLICSGCDFDDEPIEVIESTQRPEFILGVGTYVNNRPHPPIMALHTVCVWLNVPYLLRMGDRADTLNHHLYTHSILTINGVEKSIDLSSNSLADLRFQYDENNNLIGTYSSNLHLCYGIDDLNVGMHPANFVTESTDGKAYSYSFELKVK